MKMHKFLVLSTLAVAVSAVAEVQSSNAPEPPRKDAPQRYVAGERIIFNWHNFLSSCSTWDADDWRGWVGRASSDGYNAIMRPS